MLRFEVDGLPRPKGSWKCVGRGGRHQLVEQVPSGPWRAQVTRAAAGLAARIGQPLTGPIRVHIVCTVPCPRSVKPEARPWPCLAYKVGDVDKLARCILDCLTAGGVWDDDGQVVDLHIIKCYPHSPTALALPQPGAVIRIRSTDKEMS